MRIATIASFGASAVLGLGALVVARTWLPSQVTPAKAAGQDMRAGAPVVLAAGPIAYGAKLKPTDVMLARLPADLVPPGAFTTIDQVMRRDGGGAPVALAGIAAREPLLPSKLSGPGAKPTMAALIEDGMRAYTIAVSEVAGGGGHITPGDRVDVVLTRNAGEGGPSGGPGSRMVSDVVMQNVKVLGMDQNLDPNSTRPAVAHTATLEVSMRDAERLALAAQSGTLSLALRRAGSAETADVRQVATWDLGSGPPPQPVILAAPARRARPAARPQPAAAPQPSGSSVVIVHGENRAPTSVPSDRVRAGA